MLLATAVTVFLVNVFSVFAEELNSINLLFNKKIIF